MRAFAYARPGPIRLLQALAQGTVKARALSPPPWSDVGLLANARVEAPNWWADYLANTITDARGTGISEAWSKWLHSTVVVASETASELLSEMFDHERATYRKTQATVRLPSVWSDVEALAWLASGDDHLVAKVRDFAHQRQDRAQSARQCGLDYLAFQVSSSYCGCGKQQSALVVVDRPDACDCVRSAWMKLGSALQGGAVPASVALDGTATHVHPRDFLVSALEIEGRKFRLLPIPGEVLVAREDVMALQAAPAPIPFSDDDRRVWMERQPPGNGDIAYDRYTLERRYCGTKRDAFRLEWKTVKKQTRGRPPKRTHQ